MGKIIHQIAHMLGLCVDKIIDRELNEKSN